MFPVPGLTDFVAYPFSMIVLEPVTVYELKLSDMASLLPRTQLERIKEAFRREPPDEAVAQMWIEKQQAIQWQAFKRKCVKEARESVKVEREVQNGNYAMRKPGIPKPIKDHKPLPPLTNKEYL